jgi:hypothetical protein
MKTCSVCGTELTAHNSVDAAEVRHVPGNCAQVLYSKLGETQVALRELADASEEYASSDQDMAGHAESEIRFDLALAEARRILP